MYSARNEFVNEYCARFALELNSEWSLRKRWRGLQALAEYWGFLCLFDGHDNNEDNSINVGGNSKVWFDGRLRRNEIVVQKDFEFAQYTFTIHASRGVLKYFAFMKQDDVI